jgi:flagellar hook protein FlgE
MKNFQTKLDVIGNNIANVNTYGFKKGRTTFKDLVSQQIAGASAPNANRGGVNAKQVGLGSQLSTIDTIHTQGSLQTTGRPLDLSISGDGYFVVGEGATQFYTRAGNFYLDSGDGTNATLVNADGLKVMDTTGTGEIQIPLDAQSFSISNDRTVNYIDATGAVVTAGQIGIAKFANNGGLEKAGNNLFQASTNSGAAQIDAAGVNGGGDIVAGTLEMSNVDLSEEFTEMIVAQRGFQANTRIITTSDEILQELVNLKR